MMFEIPPRPEWWDRAVCKGTDPLLFFPYSRGDNERVGKQAKRVCRGCPVRVECLEEGMNHRDGIWGGKSYVERRAIKRAGLTAKEAAA
jgi:WhiB family redox-sensing transcriptional regulator